MKSWTFFRFDLKKWLLENESNNWTLFERDSHFFEKNLKELNPSFQHDSQNWIFLFNFTQRNWTIFLIDSKNWTFKKSLKVFFEKKWLKEFNLSFFEYDSQNWFLKTLTELNLLFFFTQRIEPFFWYHSKNWTFIFKNHSKNWTWLKIWTFFQ